MLVRCEARGDCMNQTANAVASRYKGRIAMPRRSFLGAMMIGLPGLLGGCGFLADYRYRCRLTVMIETPRGLASGASVFEVQVVRSTDLASGASGAEAHIRGEAVAVDLPQDRTIFGLLKTNGISGNDNLAVMSMRALDPAFGYDLVATAKRLRSKSGVRTSAPVQPQDYPLFVTFEDLADPHTVRLIDPAQLAAVVGAGTRLVSIMVELTNEHLTDDLQRRIPWLRSNPSARLDNDFQPTTHPTLAQQLREGDFRRAAFQQY